MAGFLMSRLAVSVALLVLGVVAPVYAAEDPRDTADPSRFVEKAIQDGLTEVQMGKVAQEKSTSTDVKAFGARMVTDHGNTNAELAAIAKKKNLKVPTALDSEHRALVTKLTAESGANFDAAYSHQMTTDHAKAIDLFTQATQGMDSELAAFSRKTLPTLKEHKAMADNLARRTLGNVPTRSSSDR
jgi:putative membrane protein